MQKILILLKRRYDGARQLLQIAFAIALVLSVAAPTVWAEETEAVSSAEREYGVQRIIERFEKETGQKIRLGGSSLPDANAESPAHASDFPSTIEGLAELLGIESYATLHNDGGPEIELIALKIRSSIAAQAGQEASLKGAETQARETESELPFLSPEEQAQVFSFYEGLRNDHGTSIDAAMTADDRRRLHEEALLSGPYLTDEQEREVLQFYEEMNAVE